VDLKRSSSCKLYIADSGSDAHASSEVLSQLWVAHMCAAMAADLCVQIV